MKETILRITKKDFRFDYFSGTGKGGQHRNKHKNSCRCFHDPSNSMGVCQDNRSKEQNTKVAWRRCIDSKKFQEWMRIEICRVSGELEELKKHVDESMKNIKIEIMKDGKWTKE